MALREVAANVMVALGWEDGALFVLALRMAVKVDLGMEERQRHRSDDCKLVDWGAALFVLKIIVEARQIDFGPRSAAEVYVGRFQSRRVEISFYGIAVELHTRSHGHVLENQ